MSDRPTAERIQVITDLLGLVVAVRPRERALIGIDGPDGVGKSSLLAELLGLAPVLAGREVLGVSIDGFHHPQALRYATGRDSRSSYDYDAFLRKVVEPFRAGLEIVPAVHDVAGDERVFPDPIEPSDDAVLLVEGVFLRRPQLQQVFDAVLLVEAPLEVSVPRGNARFARPAAENDPDHPANERYVGAQRRYRYETRRDGAHPTWILDNTDLGRPLLLDPEDEDDALDPELDL